MFACYPLTAADQSVRGISFDKFQIDGPKWNVSIASFGDLIPNGAQFDVFLPSIETGFLCSFPEEAVGENVSLFQWDHPGSFYSRQIAIGLLAETSVSCSVEQQANVLARLQEFVPQLQVLLLSGENVNETQPKTLQPESANISGVEQSLLEKVAILYLPGKLSPLLKNKIQVARSQPPSASPYFLDVASALWHFTATVEDKNGAAPRGSPGQKKHTDDDFTKDSSPSGGAGAIPLDDADSILRYILFSLLIIAPCFRACYLWYTGGGRLHWRRNEQGRIVGIQYIPPIPFWLAAGRFPMQPRLPVTEIITQEQFANLPEIKYEIAACNCSPSGSISGDENNRGSSSITLRPEPEAGLAAPNVVPELVAESTQHIMPDPTVEISKTVPVDIEKQLSKTSRCSELDADSSRGDASPTPGESAATPSSAVHTPSGDLSPEPSDLAQTNRNDGSSAPVTTTSTICSICIDDFVVGETLTLLPRCRHAFHRECIYPWLLERQGCCPFCKTSVLPNGQERDESSFSTDDASQDGTSARESRESEPSQT
jgi:Ring finger domain